MGFVRNITLWNQVKFQRNEAATPRSFAQTTHCEGVIPNGVDMRVVTTKTTPVLMSVLIATTEVNPINSRALAEPLEENVQLRLMAYNTVVTTEKTAIFKPARAKPA